MMKSWKTFVYFMSAYPVRGLVMVMSLTVAGILEGIGVIALLPLITILTDQGQAQGGVVTEVVQAIFDTVGVEPTVLSALLFIVGAMMLKAVVNMVAVIQIAYASSHVGAELRLNYIHSLLYARWSHYVGLKSGATANAIGTEAQRAAISFKQGCQVLSYLLQIIVYAALALLVSWKLTLAALGAGVFMVFILGFLTREARRSGAKMTNIYEDMLSLITDAFYGAKPLKAMSKGPHLFRLLEKDIRACQSAQRRLDIVDQSLIVLSEPIMVIFVAAGLYGALSIGALPIAQLLFMAVLFLRTVMRVSSAQRSYQSMASNESALWSLQNKIDAAKDLEEDFSGTKIPTLKQGITIDNVSFAYQDVPILENISFELPANKLHVIYGPSGTGKTTMVDMIIGLHQPGTGDIRIDDTPLSEVDLRAWRRMVGYVPQDVLLFHDSILNNVTLNDIDFDRDDVERALKMAGAWDFVKEMEDGVDTIVGERGSRLSGGQRQRVAIARAIIHEPALLVLDEATSALDPKTEQQILKTVKALSKKMTVLAISHNPAILDVADSVYDIQKESEIALVDKESVNG